MAAQAALLRHMPSGGAYGQDPHLTLQAHGWMLPMLQCLEPSRSNLLRDAPAWSLGLLLAAAENVEL